MAAEPLPAAVPVPMAAEPPPGVVPVPMVADPPAVVPMAAEPPVDVPVAADPPAEAIIPMMAADPPAVVPIVIEQDHDGEHASSMLEQLVPELSVRLLGFLDVRDSMQLSTCSTNLQERVCGCKEAWQVISFRPVKDIYRQQISDGQLATLLAKVNAKQVTKELYLCGCHAVRDGHAIKPLRFSRVLEKISLWNTGAKNNMSSFLWVLQTLLPYKFYDLLVEYTLFEKDGANKDEYVDFLWKLREAKQEQAQETLCSTCDQPVMDPSRQVIPNEFGFPETHCKGCSKSFCKQANCSTCFRECEHCHESYCDDCKVVFQCSFCGVSHCSVSSCGGKFTTCQTCDKLCCKDCEGLVNCDYCKKRKTCLECANYDICEKECTLCGVCQDKGNCSVCSGQFCVQCIRNDVRQCHECRLVFCDKPTCTSMVEWCGAKTVCDLIFCKACREFEYCVLCDKSYCLQHDRLVDCFKCGMRHCRKCGYKRQCLYCNRGCYEECICEVTHPPLKKQKSPKIGTMK